MMTTSGQDSAAIRGRPCSASILEIPYGSCGAGVPAVVKGRSAVVASPLTLTELAKTKRRTSEAAASWMRCSVLSTLTLDRRNSSRGLSANSVMTFTRAAVCTTAWQSASACLQSVASSSAEITTRLSLSNDLSERRTASLARKPTSMATRHTLRPTKPFAPVMSIVMPVRSVPCAFRWIL